MSVSLIFLAKILPTAHMVTLKALLLLLVDPSHVVLHTSMLDKGLMAPLSLALVWLLSTVAQLMPGELVLSAEAPLTVPTRERFSFSLAVYFFCSFNQ